VRSCSAARWSWPARPAAAPPCGWPSRSLPGVFPGRGQPSPEHPAGPHVGRADLHQVVPRDHSPGGDQAPRLAQPQPVDRVADAARVGEPGLAHPQRHVLGERLARGAVHPVLLPLQHHLGDPQQLVQGEVGEVDMVRDPGGHARVGPEEDVHPAGVPGQDHHQVFPVRLHELEQDLDGLLAVVPLVLRPVQVVGLVDEQHPAHGPLEHFLGLGRGVPDVLADQVVAGHADQLPGAQVSQLAQQFTHARGQRGLPGSGASRKAHMQARPRRREAVALPQPVDQQQRGDLADPVLDRRQPDELLVEPGQQRGDPQRLLLRAQVHPGIRAERRWAGAFRLRCRRPGVPGPGHGEPAGRGLGWCAHQPSRAPSCSQGPSA